MSIFPLKVPKRQTKFPLKIYKNVISLSEYNGRSIAFGVKPDGTLVCSDSNKDLSAFKDIVSIVGLEYGYIGYFIARKSDGSWITDYQQNQSILDTFKNVVKIVARSDFKLVGLKSDGTLICRDNKIDVSMFKNIVDIDVSLNALSIMGLKQDGTCILVNYTYNSNNGTYTPNYNTEVAKWTDVVRITCNKRVGALKSDGTCYEIGVSQNSQNGYTITTWKDIVDLKSTSAGYIGLRSDGVIISNDSKFISIPWYNSNIIAIYNKDNFVGGLKTDGSITLAYHYDRAYYSHYNWGIALPPDDKKSLITSKTPTNLLDKTKVKGFSIEGIQPANTNRKVAFKVDNKWNKLTTEGALSELSTQEITSDSVLAEGNTAEELTALTNVPALAGKLVYPAFALYADSEATVMPTIGMTVKAEIDTTFNVYTKTDYSQEFVLHNKRDVLVKSISVDSNTKGNGKVTLKARYATFNETAITDEGAELTEKWSDYVDLLFVINVKCHKLQIRADYQVSITDGSDSATLNDVIITYAKEVVAKADGTTDLVTLTEKFTNDLTYVHAYIKHKELIDADLKAYVRLQKTPKKAEFKLIGYGTGARKTYKVTDSGINQDSLMVYVNGKAVYDFDFNTETSEITLVADVDVPINASYEFGWELFNYVEMQKGVSQINDSGAYTTEYSYTIPEHEGEYTVTAIKYELIRPEGKVTNEVIGVGTGKRQIIQLPHYARKETIQCNGKWSYDYDSKRLTVIAPADTDIVISYDWIAESPVVYGVMAGWAD